MAILSLRSNINCGIRAPQMLNDLVAHYRKHELTTERKAYATVDAHESYLTLHILPKWGECKLSEVKTVAVEQWGKVIGWHSFRHCLATNLRALGVDVKVAHELLRYANLRTTMDLYTQAVSAEKRNGSLKQTELLLA